MEGVGVGVGVGGVGAVACSCVLGMVLGGLGLATGAGGGLGGLGGLMWEVLARGARDVVVAISVVVSVPISSSCVSLLIRAFI